MTEKEINELVDQAIEDGEWDRLNQKSLAFNEKEYEYLIKRLVKEYLRNKKMMKRLKLDLWAHNNKN
jgi:hypothetical protein